MNRFNQKVRETALEKQIEALKEENQKLKYELRLQKDALLMELKEKNSYKLELAKEKQSRLELSKVYEELLQLIDKEAITEKTVAKKEK